MSHWHIRLGATGNDRDNLVECDGVPVADVRSVTVASAVGEWTTVVVEYVRQTVVIEAETQKAVKP